MSIDTTAPSGNEVSTRRGPSLSRALFPLVLGALAIAVIAGAVSLGLTGELTDRTAQPIVEILAVLVKAGEYLALSLSFGYAMTLALFEPGGGRARGEGSPALTPGQNHLRRRAALFTGAYLVLLALSTFVTYAGAFGSANPQALGYYLGSTDIGTTTLWAGIFGVAALVFALVSRHLRGVGWFGCLLALSVVALGFLGHAGNSTDHANAVNAMILHLLGMVTWLGPLLVFAVEAHRVSAGHLARWLQRYSPWALFAVGALAFSGVVNGIIRLEAISQLVTTAYGALVLAKAVLLLGLAALGALQRTRTLAASTVPSDSHSSRGARPRGERDVPVGLFRRLAFSEFAVAAAILGISIALGRSEPPVPQYVPVEEFRVLSLVGYEPPLDEYTLASLVTHWHIDWVFTAIALTLAGFYIAGVRRLVRRGDTWPKTRVVFWLLGCLALIWVMSGGPAAFGRIRFDAHMTQHMALMVIVPPLLTLGAPVTLLSRAVQARSDGSRGIREWVLAILHSGYANVVSSPPVAGFLFAGSLVIFYFSPLFTWAMFAHAGHLFMTVHFLLAGYLFAWVIMGIDPAQRPINPVLKLVTLLATLTFHAFFGVAVVSATWLIGAEWYETLNLFPREELVRQQVAGGSIMWGISEIPTVFYAMTAAVLWNRSEERRARQFDRKADRDGNAELDAYNEYLKSLREGAGRES